LICQEPSLIRSSLPPRIAQLCFVRSNRSILHVVTYHPARCAGAAAKHRPSPGSLLVPPRRTKSSLTHGAATTVHCRGTTFRQWDQRTANWQWLAISPKAHGPQHLKKRLSWLKKTNPRRRTDERQNTQRENTQQRSDSAHTYIQPTQLKLLEHPARSPPRP